MYKTINFLSVTENIFGRYTKYIIANVVNHNKKKGYFFKHSKLRKSAINNNKKKT